MDGEVGNRWGVTAQGTAFVALDLDVAEGRAQAFIDENLPGHRLTDTEQFLDYFGRLQRPHGAAESAQNTGFGAGGYLARRRGFAEKAAITGPVFTFFMTAERI